MFTGGKDVYVVERLRQAEFRKLARIPSTSWRAGLKCRRKPPNFEAFGNSHI
jgi:hypothetical protein